MKHVAPHVWADAFAGKLAEREVAELDRHADDCARCRTARDRVQRASSSFPALRAQQAPELGWDSIRARVHWSVSTERHVKVHRVPHLRAWIGAGILAVGAASVVVALHVQHAHPQPTPIATHAPVAPKPATLAASVSRLAGDVLVDGVVPDHPFAHPIGAGTVIATGRSGRIDAQFGEASAFALGPRSQLELRRFDAEVIELAVDGTVDVVVSARGKNQRFLVDAGDRVIEVRGTRFAVKHGATGTTVACQHGLVAVRDANDASHELEVGAARKASMPTGHAISDVHAVPLSADELDELARTTPWATPGWTPDLVARTAPLEIVGPSARMLRVDGVELGAAPFAVRVAPGRHTVEAADPAGRFKRAGWVDVGTEPTHFTANIIDDAPPADGARVRGKQLHAGVDHARLAQCTRAIAKQGLTGAYVQIEIAVDSAGAVSFLNVLDTDLPESTASCARDALAAVHFGRGPAATWRERGRALSSDSDSGRRRKAVRAVVVAAIHLAGVANARAGDDRLPHRALADPGRNRARIHYRRGTRAPRQARHGGRLVYRRRRPSRAPHRRARAGSNDRDRRRRSLRPA